jgi:hypothetical protein
MADVPSFLTAKDRAQLNRLARKRDRKIRELQDAANRALIEFRAEVDVMLDRYDLPYQAKDIDLTTGEIYIALPLAGPPNPSPAPAKIPLAKSEPPDGSSRQKPQHR